MCRRCEGESIEAVTAGLADAIESHGFAIQQVADPRSGWTYSIGLQTGSGHPDLFCIDVEPKVQAELISRVGRAIMRGSALQPTLVHLDVTLIEVHEAHLSGGRFASWERIEGRAPRAGEVVQVVPGASWFCPCHASSVRRFDQPQALPRRSSRRGRRQSRNSNRRLQLPPSPEAF